MSCLLQASPALLQSVKSSDEEEKRSSGVDEMLEAMNGEMTDEQMKQNLMKALDKRVPQQHVKTERTKLPRFTALNTAQTKKPITPGNKDWEKIHKKNFSKMESIQDYMAKKQERNEQLSASMHKIKQMREKLSKCQGVRNYKTPPSVKKVCFL